jgi:P4 family phage/plasmid primase-like protien
MDSHKKMVEGAATLSLQNTTDISLSQLNELTLQEFLDTYPSKDTYNLLGLKGGKWLIPKCNYKVFYNLLAKAIQTNKRKLYYVEYPLKGSNKVIIDADFYQTTSKRLYTKDTIHTLLKLYEIEIRKYIDKEVVFIVSERDKPYKRLNKYKDGFHTIAPHIRLPTNILQEIRTNVLEQVGNLFINEKITNTKENIIDKAIISSNGWQPIGCYKPTKKPYEISYIYENGKLNKPKGKIKDEDLGDFLYSMSIWNNEIDVEPVPLINQEEETKPSKQKVTYSEEELIVKLEKIGLSDIKLKQDCYGTYEVQYNHLSPCPVSGVEDHDNIACQFQEDKYRNLYLYCYSDKCKGQILKLESKFDRILSDLYKYGCQHQVIAEFIELLFPNKFKSNGKFFYYSNKTSGLWQVDEMGNKLFKSFKSLDRKIESIMDYNEEKASKTDDESKANKYYSKNEKLIHVLSKIRDNNFQKNVISQLKNIYYEKDIDTKFDEVNLYLIAFSNGVYDFKTNTFRSALPEEYVFRNTGYPFPKNSNKEVREQIFNFLNSCFSDTETRDYLLKVFASTLIGHRRYEQLYFLTGRGRNGKGTLFNFIENVFGEYIKTIDCSFFTTIPKSSNSATPEIADKNGVRILWSSEPEDIQKFQVNKLKLISGGDKIQVRKLYCSPFEYRPQFSVFIQANDLPELSNIGDAISDRARIITFPYRFVSNPTNEYERKGDPKIKEEYIKSKEWRDEMMLILIEYYNKYIKYDNSMSIPMSKYVEEASNEYINDNDPIKEWLNKYYNITKNSDDKIATGELYSQFKDDNLTTNITNRNFGKLIKFNKVGMKRSHGKRYYTNIIPKKLNY